MDPKKNPIAAMIVAKSAKPTGAGPMDGSEGAEPEPDEEGLQAAADDIMAAIDKRDTAGLASALKALVQMC
jgi:hypothetical protein